MGERRGRKRVEERSGVEEGRKREREREREREEERERGERERHRQTRSHTTLVQETRLISTTDTRIT